MLSETQVKRLLAQCESAYKSQPREEWAGWIQALRLVMEKSTYPIRNSPLKNEDIG